MIDAERLAVVKQELMELDPMWREVLVLRDVEGQDYATIGEILDLTIGTVKSRIHRARSELGRRVRRRLRTHREPASQAGGS